MIRLIKYLNPYLPLLLLAVALLYVQANADLALPDYLSKIVNVGIQQGGVENAVPVAIGESAMNRLIIFMKSNETELVLSHYTLVKNDNQNYSRYVQLYPTLAKEPIYIRNSINSTEISKLNPIIGKVFMIVFGIEQVLRRDTGLILDAVQAGEDQQPVVVGDGGAPSVGDLLWHVMLLCVWDFGWCVRVVRG